MIRSYWAIIDREGDHCTVEFPAFGIKGRACPEWEDSAAFAEDFLAEIILDWEEKGKTLPAARKPGALTEMPAAPARGVPTTRTAPTATVLLLPSTWP